MNLAPGMLVSPNIRLERELGHGGMGSVWSASHLTLETRVAVKFIATELLEQSPDAVARFLREGRAVARIRSPHVVQVFDLGTLGDGTPYIVMELLDGESLGDLLERIGRILSPSEALPILEQVGKALEHAHAAGIVHRDIKPANVFLTRSGHDLVVKVLDFGIAKQTALPQVSASTATGTLMGTPEYMSPEQVVSAKDVDFRADLWAFAVVAYELLVGTVPFCGETLGALIVAITRHAYTPPGMRVPAIPRELDAWFARAFAPNLNARFASAKEMTSSLAQACDSVVGSRRAFPDTLPFGALAPPARDGVGTTVPAAPPAAMLRAGPPALGLQRLVDSESFIQDAAPPPTAPVPVRLSPGVASPAAPSSPAAPPTFSGAATTLSGASARKPLSIVLGVSLLALLGAGAGVAFGLRASDGSTTSRGQSVTTTSSAMPMVSGLATSASAEVPGGAAIVPVPPGEYTIGCSPTDHRCFDDERPPYRVNLSAFGILVHEVTAEEYDACVLNGRCGEPGQGDACTWRKPGRERMPITCVTQQDARDYCAWKGLVLPTEAQWEVAARGRSGGDFPWAGDAIDCSRAAVDHGCGTKGPLIVGSRPADASWVGARDMAGNVREWTASQYTAYPGGKIDAQTRGAVNRGASWVMTSKDANTLHTRGVDAATERRPDLGFRCVRP
ncbi:MAG: SUMF1/EgtB/PvdO family nonheme iron enzyme [Deltaproteobacteria bacterium]|nr:SUMF1/EgtB/PvdO family nonheme iron enzyme [Deltaproteobacteria bacterium]